MSSERSGSNLLRVLFSNHPNLHSDPAPHFLKIFHTLISSYGDLSDKRNVEKLFQDMAAFVCDKGTAWNLKLDFEALYDEFRPKSFLDCFQLFYSASARQNSKKRFVVKENNLFDFAFQLVHYYKSPGFIYLYRDPRDYVASWMRLSHNSLTPYAAALRWAQEQEKCDELIHGFNLPVFKIRYEELISNTAQVMRGALSYLGEPYSERCCEVDTQKTGRFAWNESWTNISKPVIKDNSGRYRNFLKKTEIRLIESVAQVPMLKLGYELETRADWKPSRAFRWTDKIHGKLKDLRFSANRNQTKDFLSMKRNLVKNLLIRQRALISQGAGLRSGGNSGGYPA